MDEDIKNPFPYTEHEEQVANTQGLLAPPVVYGPGGVRGLFSSGYVLGAASLASLGGFSFGYDQGVMSIINVMDQFHQTFPQAETAFGTGFMTGMLLLGAFIGCLFMPYLVDKISRKWALTCVVVIFDIGAIIQTAAQNYGMLVAGRTVGGIGVGTLAMMSFAYVFPRSIDQLSSCAAPLYISEISPPNLRGTLLVLESVSIVSGVVIAYWITFVTRHMAGEISFRLPIGLQMVCATILGFGIHLFPYSPRWLAMVDRRQESLASLTKLRGLPATDNRICAEYEGIIAELELEKLLQEKRYPGASVYQREMNAWKDLFKNWRRTVVGCGVCFFQQFLGVNAFIYYAPTLFRSLGQSDEMSLIMSGIFNVLQLVAVAVCFLIIDQAGRRPLAIFGACGSFVCYVLIAILSGLYSHDWASHVAAGWACVAMAFGFILVFGVSYSPLAWALPSEVFPTTLRSKGVALSTCINWLSNFIIGVITPPMMSSCGYRTYIFFAVWCFLAGIWAFFLVPETSGKTLEEIDGLFGDTRGTEESEMVREAIALARSQMSSLSV